MPRRKRPKTYPVQSQLEKRPTPETSNFQRTSEHSSLKAATSGLVCRPGQGGSRDQEGNSWRTPGQDCPPSKTALRSGIAAPKRKRKLSSGAEDQPPRNPTLGVPGDEVTSVAPDTKKRCAEPRRATFASSYSVGELLGSGGCGSVYKGTRKSDGEDVAIKYITKGKYNKYITMPGDGRRLPQEVALMTIVNEPPGCLNVLKLLDWFEDPFQYILVLERPSPCTDLFDFCGLSGSCLSEMQAKQIMKQVVEALIHCRNRSVFHRDVKLENLLINLNDWTVKLIDFGLGALDKNGYYRKFAGTWDYCPPEFFVKRCYKAIPSTTWSLGVLLFELVCGDRPFEAREDIILNEPTIPECLSKECNDLIKWCLRTNPEERPVLEDILSHDWLLGHQGTGKGQGIKMFLDSKIH